jgi:hypothetical protein
MSSKLIVSDEFDHETVELILYVFCEQPLNFIKVEHITNQCNILIRFILQHFEDICKLWLLL